MQEFTPTESEFDADYLTCVSRLAESLDGDAYAGITEAMALQYAEAGQLERAVELAEQIPDAYARDSALAVVTAKAVASGQDDYATEILETIEDPILYNRAIEEMSIEFARQGQFDAALSLTEQLSNNASAIGSIATIYWQRGLKDEAMDLARSIEPLESATTLAQLARLSDDSNESSNLLVEAQQVAEEIDSAELKVAALLAIASGYEEQSDRERSLEALNRAIEACEDYESANPIGLSGHFARDEALLQILEALLRLQDVSKATDVADEIEDEFLFTGANLKLAVARGESLDETKATIINLRPYSEQEAQVRDALIVDLAKAYANLGDYAEARRIIHSVISEEIRGLALKELGKHGANAGNDHVIFEIEEDLRSQYDKAQYWLAIYDSTSSRNPELSEKAFAKALSCAEDIERPAEKAAAFTGLGLTLTKNQRTGQAENLFLAATNAVTTIEDSFLKARALLRLAKASQETGRKPNQNEQQLLDQIT